MRIIEEEEIGEEESGEGEDVKRRRIYRSRR